MRRAPRASPQALLARGDHLVGGAARQFREVVELGFEGADARGGGAQFDDEVADFRLGDQRAQRFPAVPARAPLEAEDLPAPGAHQGAGARQRVGGHVDRHRENGLQQNGPGLGQRLGERGLGRGAKRHVGGIDGVIGAVDQGDGDVDDGEAERPARQRVAGAHLDGGKRLARHRAAVDALAKGEAFAALARADLDQHVAELAVAARLLRARRGPHAVANGLAVSDRRLGRVDRDAEAFGEALGDYAQVHLALAHQLEFARFLVLDVGERGVLLASLASAAASRTSSLRSLT